MENKQREAMKQQFEEIAEAPYRALKSISLKELDLNPFLMRALALDTPEAIARFMIGQRMERSLVTSFGARIQSVAKALTEGTGTEGADIMFLRGGKRYYVQMKAGPNNINKDIMTQINEKLSSATRRDPGSIGLLGLAYGKRERVNTIIQRYSNIDWKVGNEFWEFISGDPKCGAEVFEVAAEAAKTVSAKHGGKNYHQFLEEKIHELAGEIREEYGEGPAMWKALFEGTM
jgi:hypothetical protein